MSGEEHQFESKADAGASKSYRRQPSTIRIGDYIVIDNRACEVFDVSTYKIRKHGTPKYRFVAVDIFNLKTHEYVVPSYYDCDVPHVNITDYPLIDATKDGFVILLTENGNTKNDVKLPTECGLMTQIMDGFDMGKELVASVMSVMGEEHICAIKDISE
ncbi:eukaryotic translation initiation factor 5A-like [Rutidosis leptorrhynchoides]|uniref:eukaryotic translation initiation factor 5A-like n=1 Tax=Rutidosis leptorrhynchoides TaxID=125765 RepID=UPI003A994957